MKSFLTLFIAFFSLNLFAQAKNCTFNYDSKGSILSWTAFKTPKKAGVKAKFSEFSIESKKEAATLEDLLTSATFTVNSQSVDSGDKARDAKIAQFFFKKMMNGTKITGKVLKASSGIVDVELMMNGVKKVVTMKSIFDEATKKLTLNGSLDVLEFGMKENLATLTKACYEKHEGVTWPNVDLELVALINKNCK